MDRRRLLIVSVAFEGGMLLLAFLLGLPFGLSPLGSASPGLGATGLGLLATLPMLGLLWLIESSGSPLFAGLKREIDGTVRRLFARAGLPDLALISLLAGLGEEALFRGLLQEGLTGVAGPALALGAASALFGLAHYLSRAYAVYAALVGAYLGALYLLTGNILVPVIVHALYDFVALAWLVRIRRPPPEPVPQEELPGR